MAKKQITQAIEKLLRSALQADQKLTSQERFWLLRSGFVGRSAQAEGGFILPTVTLLLLMLSLVLGLLIFRTGNRSIEIIGEKQQRQVYNAATPAVERAKAKLEYLFGEEPLPALPSEDQLVDALQDGATYDLGDEERIDIDGDPATRDNAWSFEFDSNGDGKKDTVVAYSILTRSVNNGVELQDADDGEKADNLVVRNGPINLNGQGANPNCPDPGRSLYVGWEQITGGTLRKAVQVHAFAKSLNAGNSTVATLELQQDKQANLGNKWGAWFRYDMEIFPGPNFNWNGAMYTAGNYMMSNNGGNNNGNRDLTLYPVSDDTSCIYTEDSSEIAMGEFAPSINGTDHSWQGQFLAGSMKNNTSAGEVQMYLFEGADGGEFPRQELRGNNDSTDQTPAEIALNPVLVLTQDVNRTRTTTNVDGNRSAENYRDADWNDQPWVKQKRPHNDQEATPYVDDTFRADDRWGPKPVYRKVPDPIVKVPDGVNVTDPNNNEIAASELDLVREAPPSGNTTDEQTYGLDGYWERRARAQGVRIISGQRLELGNAFGWGNKVSEDLNGNNTLDAGEDLNGNGRVDLVTLADVENNAVDDATADSFMALAATQLLDPLYPAPAKAAGDGFMADDDRETEQRQWKSMRNNLASAQSTAVYHYLMDEGQFPVTCLASAAQPGSRDSVKNSTTFDTINLPGGGTGPNVDFLSGQGTNGWEFFPPMYGGSTNAQATHSSLVAAREDFATAVDNANSPMRVALENLAYFSGDLAGAYPPFQDSPGSNAASDGRFTEATDGGVGPITHPYPIHTMWGDFSNLRRVIEKLNGTSAYDGASRTYDELSLADKTTLQTASCTLGMLAYNVNNVMNNPAADETILADEDLVDAIRSLQTSNKISVSATEVTVEYLDVDDDDQDGDTAEVLEYKTDLAKAISGSEPLFNPDNPATAIPPEILLKSLRTLAPIDGITEEKYDSLVALHERYQIMRDRTQGFSAAGYVFETQFPQNVLGQIIPSGTAVRLHCDFETNNYLGLGEPTDASKENEFLSVAFTICPSGPKYPSLAYLFPVAERSHDGTLSTNIPAADKASGLVDEFAQPEHEPYTSSDLQIKTASSTPETSTPDYAFHNRYALNRGSAQGINYEASNERFRVVGDGSETGTGRNRIEDVGDVGLAAIALTPNRTPASWALPSTTNATGRINKVVFDGTAYWTALLDKGFFNGRESLTASVMDVDLDLLRRSEVTGRNAFRGATQTDFWLPLPEIADPTETSTRTGAIIYAFREDTRREDGIARPRLVNDPFATWSDEWRDYSRQNFDNQYLMDAIGAGGTFSDPPANPENGLSPKAVDFFADPERRPSGFRLRNGADLRRIRNNNLVLDTLRRTDDPELRGMSFISDASVYIQGDFNLHSLDGTTDALIEEYEDDSKLEDDWSNFFDRIADDLNETFARKEDSWRATEVIADAVNILSKGYTGVPANNTDDWFAAKDGWLKQAWLNDNGRDVATNTSFMQFTRPSQNRGSLRWVLENGKIDRGINSGQTGIKVSHRGFPLYCALPNGNNNTALDTGDYCIARGGVEREYGLYNSQDYERVSDARRRPQGLNAGEGNDTWVNAVVVSGTVPSRAGNSYGGLHNFPRFIENWNTNLRFAGSLFQLNFSASATAPFDLDSWEPGTAANANAEPIPYYGPPGRLWGFDVALQYVPAAPVSERFSTRDNIRSEFYRELPADDPYVQNLRCAANPHGGGGRIDPSAQCDV